LVHRCSGERDEIIRRALFGLFAESFHAYHPGMADLINGDTTEGIIGAFYEVYNILGFGFLESTYVKALERELRGRGHHVAREVSVPVMYKGELLSNQRLDMIVDRQVVVETKSTMHLPKGARRQVFNYLKATNLEVGLLLHFGPKASFYREIRTNPKDESQGTNSAP
jgi:GxxExxY protein